MIISSILNSSEFGVVEMSDHTSALPTTAVAFVTCHVDAEPNPGLFYEGIVGSSRMLDFPPSVGVLTDTFSGVAHMDTPAIDDAA